MNVFGFEIKRSEQKALQSVDSRGGWWGVIREAYSGAWQSNVEVKLDTVLTQSTVFRCISLISSDIAKMRVNPIKESSDGVLVIQKFGTKTNPLKKPNRFQNRIQFFQNWIESKLIHGNTYILKQRDNRNNITALYILDATSVKPLVADDGSVFYQLTRDDLAGVGDDKVTVPASEIIHDRFNTIYHPLVGVSPIYACGLAAVQGLRIQNNSANFFGNNSNPGGILTAPGAIADETASRLKEHWDKNYSGSNAGKVAVLGDGLKYEAMAVNPVDAQLIEQLGWSDKTICTVFGVPAYKCGVGDAPTYNNIEALDAQYYAQCLQIHIESAELALDEGLGLTGGVRTQFNLDDLLRMDTETMIKSESEAVKAGIKAPNESRKRLNLKPVDGGDSPYLQQQNYSLEALAKRDAEEPPANDNLEIEDQRSIIQDIREGLGNVV